MNKLSSEVCRILDFSEDYLSTAISEADSKEKLRNTYMFVNGTLTYVKAFVWSVGCVLAWDIKTDAETTVEVETLEPWLPLTGLYITDKIAVHISKKAHKHWKKSFVYDNYRFEIIKNNLKHSDCHLYQELSNTTPEPIAIVDKAVYFNLKTIGKIGKDNIISCTKPQFYQELLDFSNRKGLNWMIQ